MIKLLIKILRLLFVLIIVVAASGFAYHLGWLKSHPLAAQINRFKDAPPNSWSDLKNVWQGKDGDTAETENSSLKLSLEQVKLDELSQNAGDQIKLMSERALEAGKVAKDFVAGSVEVDEKSEKNLSERAFEYGQYIYCKAVVDNWEKETTPTDF